MADRVSHVVTRARVADVASLIKPTFFSVFTLKSGTPGQYSLPLQHGQRPTVQNDVLRGSQKYAHEEEGG